MSKVHLPDMSKEDLVVLVKRLNGQIKFLQQQGAPTGVVLGPNGTVTATNANSTEGALQQQQQRQADTATIKQLRQENNELHMRLKSSQEQITLMREELGAKTDEVKALTRQIALLSDQLVESQATVEDLLKRQQQQNEEWALQQQINSANAAMQQQQQPQQQSSGNTGGSCSSPATSAGGPSSSLTSPKMGAANANCVGHRPPPQLNGSTAPVAVGSVVSSSHHSAATANSAASGGIAAQAERTIVNLQMRISELEETLDFYATIVQAQDATGGTSVLIKAGSSPMLKKNTNKGKMGGGDGDAGGASTDFDPFGSSEPAPHQAATATTTSTGQPTGDGDVPALTASPRAATTALLLNHYKAKAEQQLTVIQQLYEECAVTRQDRDALMMERNRLRKRLETLDGLAWFAARPVKVEVNTIVESPSPVTSGDDGGDDDGQGRGGYVNYPTPEAASSPSSSAVVAEQRSPSVENGTAATIVHDAGSGGFARRPGVGGGGPSGSSTNVRASGVGMMNNTRASMMSTNTRASRASTDDGGDDLLAVPAQSSFLQNLFGLGGLVGGTKGGPQPHHAPMAALLGRGRTSSHMGPTNGSNGTLLNTPNHTIYNNPSHFPRLNYDELPDKNLKGTLTSREQKLLDRTNAVEAYVEQILEFNSSRQRNYDELDKSRAELFASLNEKLQQQKDEITKLSKEVKALTLMNKVYATAKQTVATATTAIDEEGNHHMACNATTMEAARCHSEAQTEHASPPSHAAVVPPPTSELGGTQTDVEEVAQHSNTVTLADATVTPPAAAVDESAIQQRIDDAVSVALSGALTEAEAKLTAAVAEAESRGRKEGVTIAKDAARAAVTSQKLQFDSAYARNEAFTEAIVDISDEIWGCYVGACAAFAKVQSELVAAKEAADAANNPSPPPPQTTPLPTAAEPDELMEALMNRTEELEAEVKALNERLTTQAADAETAVNGHQSMIASLQREAEALKAQLADADAQQKAASASLMAAERSLQASAAVPQPTVNTASGSLAITPNMVSAAATLLAELRPSNDAGHEDDVVAKVASIRSFAATMVGALGGAGEQLSCGNEQQVYHDVSHHHQQYQPTAVHSTPIGGISAPADDGVSVVTVSPMTQRAETETALGGEMDGFVGMLPPSSVEAEQQPKTADKLAVVPNLIANEAEGEEPYTTVDPTPGQTSAAADDTQHAPAPPPLSPMGSADGTNTEAPLSPVSFGDADPQPPQPEEVEPAAVVADDVGFIRGQDQTAEAPPRDFPAGEEVVDDGEGLDFGDFSEPPAPVYTSAAHDEDDLGNLGAEGFALNAPIIDDDVEVSPTAHEEIGAMVVAGGEPDDVGPFEASAPQATHHQLNAEDPTSSLYLPDEAVPPSPYAEDVAAYTYDPHASQTTAERTLQAAVADDTTHNSATVVTLDDVMYQPSPSVVLPTMMMGTYGGSVNTSTHEEVAADARPAHTHHADPSAAAGDFFGEPVGSLNGIVTSANVTTAIEAATQDDDDFFGAPVAAPPPPPDPPISAYTYAAAPPPVATTFNNSTSSSSGHKTYAIPKGAYTSPPAASVADDANAINGAVLTQPSNYEAINHHITGNYISSTSSSAPPPMSYAPPADLYTSPTYAPKPPQVNSAPQITSSAAVADDFGSSAAQAQQHFASSTADAAPVVVAPPMNDGGDFFGGMQAPVAIFPASLHASASHNQTTTTVPADAGDWFSAPPPPTQQPPSRQPSVNNMSGAAFDPFA